MGAPRDSSLSRQHRLCCFLTLWLVVQVVLVQAEYHVAPNTEVDSDLVFDSLESTNSKSTSSINRISRKSRAVTKQKPNVENGFNRIASRTVEPTNHHWITTTVDRIKRSISSFFKLKDEEKPTTFSKRKLRQANQNGQQNVNSELDDADLFNDNSNYTQNYKENEIGYDDEDMVGFSGDPGSGEVHSISSNHPLYIRFQITVSEPFLEDYTDRNSIQFQSLSKRIQRSIEDLYKNTPGTQSATVITIEKHKDDQFKVRVTVDVDSQNYSNEGKLVEVLSKNIQNHRIGDFQADPEDFHHHIFEGRSSCNELSCRNGDCVPHSARCNGINDCQDNSDEEGCFESQKPSYEDNASGTTAAPVVPPEQDLVGSGDGEREIQNTCRADDVIRCTDGSRYICEAHLCDGTPDCADGGDEKNCPSHTTDCATGEFICDINRCIPLSKRCDGLADCSDQTDEQQCHCHEGQFQCDNTRCVLHEKRCDRVQDCNDGTDEHNCPQEYSCRADQFDCGDGQCIHNTERCNGQRNCRNNNDEHNCSIVQCRGDEFICGNGRCISFDMKCNGFPDCEDHSDERNCPCEPTEFRCANGFCIPAQQRCDGTHQCQDKSDEIGCKINHCQNYQFQCLDGTCIDLMNKCNYKKDCPDGSDEIGCSACKSDEFRCSNGTCLNIAQRCDSVADCAHSEDEESCATCNQQQFKCANGDCIPIQNRCNNRNECSDGSDEHNCHGIVPVISDCGEGEFQCAEGFCIADYKKCNQIFDCPSGIDEENCTFTEPTLSSERACKEGDLVCDNGNCIPGKKCDGIIDCLDSSDEKECGLCQINQFTCHDGQCIDEHKLCDGQVDCYDASDENSCESCPVDQFRCSNGLCLSANRRCDGIDDCTDRSDENDCPEPNSPTKSCPPNDFKCEDGSCVSSEFVCDGYGDCKGGDDERNCGTDNVGCFRCSSGECISIEKECDGIVDCNDRSDESQCPQSQCQNHEFRCNDGKCIARQHYCNGVSDCQDGSDEAQCPCSGDRYQCLNGECIPNHLRCNGRNDCRDASDEYNCRIETTPTPTDPMVCSNIQRPCQSGNQCIDENQFCDGRIDCNDASDESNCPKNVGSCLFGEFQCDNGVCISEDKRCDGKLDCPEDPSDELDCSASNIDGLNLRTYPTSQQIRENIYKLDREVVFQCRDEGAKRARVRWTRVNGAPLPPGSRDNNGRLEIPNIKIEHSGTYECHAVEYSNQPGSVVAVQLHVDKSITPQYRPPTACALHEATCSNGDCISKERVCDGKYDCTDGSDEIRCNPNGCEPNEFRCSNKKCIMKTWKCDSENDCGDNSDEENCPSRGNGRCSSTEFTCHSGNFCIPKSYHCDMERDCMDGSDEIGCAKPVISKPGPPLVNIGNGEEFRINCTAVAVPTPEIVWRLNWHHVPSKCTMTSENGIGYLTCPNIQVEDQGAYSCEAINIKGTTFAIPDTILVVHQETVCQAGYFNSEAHVPSECIPCFCFGHTSECRSADLYVYHFQPPFDSLNLLGVKVDPRTGDVEIRNEPIYRNYQPQLSHSGPNGVHAIVPEGVQVDQPNLVPYFEMPENYHGNQLKSYGGSFRYNVQHSNRGYPTPGPDIIISGNGYTLVHKSRHTPLPNTEEQVSVQLFYGEWLRPSAQGPETLASREEIMMVLANIDNILIKLQYNEGPLDTSITKIVMDSAGSPNSDLGSAKYVEQCSCPVGYSGFSCEKCDNGYTRYKSGPWLGQCYREDVSCQPGTYLDNGECKICPCPHTNPSNQFARTCSLHPDGGPICDCPPEYVGRYCETCAPGYSGDPYKPGDVCRPKECYGDGVLQGGADDHGQCRCKLLTTGPNCNQCKANTFHLSSQNQFGCIACFCMGVTQQCSSSSWYRDQISTVFTRSVNEFKLIDTINQNVLDGIVLRPETQEITYSNFPVSEIYYWELPSRYLGNKITSYGGYLRYSLKNTPVPGGQSSRNSAADVEIRSSNNIELLYFAREQNLPISSGQTFVVPLLEQYWQRQDGEKVDREHLLMALADIEAIYIKATYYTNTREASLSAVSLDIANERNTGSQDRALEVEQCFCPVGYKGLSCEDCDFGYTRGISGIYLGVCQPCNCNGHSNECDPETGECLNCRDHTMGPNCESCLSGYRGDPSKGIPCQYLSLGTCDCDERGSMSNECYNGACACKGNVEGNNCNRCKAGTFGLNSSNIEGCELCFCSGVASECTESNYYVEQIPFQVNEKDFYLTDQYHVNKITDKFNVAMDLNEISYNLPPSRTDRLFWSLPSAFTGNKITSYGGRLEFVQKYTQLPHATYVPDQDVIISGNGIVIHWRNPEIQQPNMANKVSVPLHRNGQWYRSDQNRDPRPASREDILIVLANIDSILVRATQSSDTASVSLSDITIDTAVEQKTSQFRTTTVEVCKCPEGYRGTSCESCAVGFYKDMYYDVSKPLGACSRCPCQNAKGCSVGADKQVVCDCLPGYTGRDCHVEYQPNPPPRPDTLPQRPANIDINIITPTIEIYEVGSTVKYNCAATSRLAPQTVEVKWTKDGGELDRNAIDDGRGLLVITNLQVSDSGRYVCQASDGYSTITKSITLTVGGHEEVPRVAVATPYIDVYESQPIEIRCAASGIPTPDLRIERQDGLRLNHLHTFEQGYFRIPSASREDAGHYRCIASSSLGSDEAQFQIDVRESQPAAQIVRPEIQPSSFSGQSDSEVVLKCFARGDIESIRWSKENGQLPYNSRETDDTLIIQRARSEDSGVYICTVRLQSGTVGHQRAHVTINESQGKVPRVNTVPERSTIAQGSNVEIQCQATGLPAPKVKWTKYGGQLGPNVAQVGSTLVITNAQIEDRGVYLCVADNIHGLNQASSVIEVNRFEVPRLEIYPHSQQTVTAGNGAHLQCRALAGEPAPSIQWTRGDNALLTSRIEEMSGGILRFSDITLEEEGQYICTATNEAGKAVATANIIVNTMPEIYVKPGTEVRSTVSDRLRLECEATGVPTPSVVLRKHDGHNLLSLNNRSNSPIAVHEIFHVQKEDEGYYICTAENAAGVKEVSIRVLVDELPTRGDITGEDAGGYKTNENSRPYQPPKKEIFEQFTAPVGTRAELRCTIDRDDGYHPTINWVRENNASLPQEAYVRGGTLYIENVQPSAAGVYKCLGIDRNTNQIIFVLNSQLDVVSPPRIKITPPKQVVSPGQHASIECSATGDQPIFINWTPVNRQMPSTVTTNGGQIIFNNIKFSDAGRYRCTARNDAGEADAVSEVFVQVINKSVPVENHQQSAPQGSSITLRCHANSWSNISNTQWFRKDIPLPQNSSIRGNILEIYNLQFEDAGRYYCEVPTPDGTSSDYIDLHVEQLDWICPPHQWKCSNRKCIDISGHCNGYDDCGDNSDEADETCYTRRRRGPTTINSYPSQLHISPSEEDRDVGESLDLECQSNEPGVITSWTKMRGRLSSNTYDIGGTLRFLNLIPENSGVYRCEATGQQGVYYKDYNLNVIPRQLEEDEPNLVEVKRATRGTNVRLDCQTNLPEPIQYSWNKLGDSLPRNINSASKSIQLNNLAGKDAGTYVCSANSAQGNVNVPIILVVTGIIPYFTQAPNSYLALQTIADHYIKFTFEISFKPENGHGLILYNGSKNKKGDFISLALVRSVPQFRFNLGQSTTVVHADHPVSNREWHTIYIKRMQKRVTMYVDGLGPYIGQADGKSIGLDLSEPLYLGGVPNYDHISSEAGVYTGFVGCISRLEVHHSNVDLFKEALNKTAITACETCQENICQNQGACQEAPTATGYSCICPEGFSGPTCNTLKEETCLPTTCGKGRCIDTDNSFECKCPLGTSGRRCEKEITVNEPAFQNGAYLAYDTPLPSRRIQISLKVKPRDLNDGILLYCGESDDGYGEFISISILDKHLEFRFDAGNDVTVIKHPEELKPDQWIILTASRSSNTGRLTVNGGLPITNRLLSNHKAFTLKTPLYIGGYDTKRIKISDKVGVHNGFNGCISEIFIFGSINNIIQNVTDSSNVENCKNKDDVDNNILFNYNNGNLRSSVPYDSFKTGCSSSPCRNNGNCISISSTKYKCNCPPSFTGANCENVLNHCKQEPCQNKGVCKNTGSNYTCDCPLGFKGINCEQRIELRSDAQFDGNGYLELNRKLLSHNNADYEEVIALELSTNASNGLILWHGQDPNVDGQGQDYLSLSIQEGYLEFSFDLGSGPALIQNSQVRVNDGQRHTIILKRKARVGSLEIDHTYEEKGEADGITASLNCAGNIFLGGTPNISLMTGGRFEQGFKGCIHGFEVQNSNSIDFGTRAVSGLNVKSCSRQSDNLFLNNLIN